MPFYDPKTAKPQEMPGRTREVVVLGKHMRMMLIHRHEGTKGGHSHPYEQMTYFIEGRARVHLGEEVKEVGPGEIVHFPPDVHHELEMLTPTLRYLEVFSPPPDI